MKTQPPRRTVAPNVNNQVALCYVRKSQVRNRTDEISPERQRANLLRAVTERNLIAEFFEDAEGHRSGRRETGRPGWLTLKSQLDRPDVAAVIVESLSRASRSVKDLYNFLAELEARAITLISLKENIDTSTAMGRAFVGFIAVMNQFESDVASERAEMNIEFLQKVKGRHWGGTPIGCARAQDDRQLVPSTEGIYWFEGQLIVGRRDAPPFVEGRAFEWRGYHDAVRRCYELYSENRTGYDRLNDQLNAEGYRARGRWGMPHLFNSDDVRRMIEMNRIYAGFTVLGRAKDGITATVKGSHEPILPVELCDRVAEVKTARHMLTHGGGGKRKYTYLFRNLYCADCNQRLSGQFQRERRWYRHYDPMAPCASLKRTIFADALEAELWQRLSMLRSPHEFKARAQERVRQMLDRANPRGLKNAETDLRRLQQSLDRLKELYVEGAFSRKEYDKKCAKLVAAQTEAQAQMRRASPDLKGIERALDRIDHFAAVLEKGTPEQQRDALDALIERAYEKDGKLVDLQFREWARELMDGAES